MNVDKLIDGLFGMVYDSKVMMPLQDSNLNPNKRPSDVNGGGETKRRALDGTENHRDREVEVIDLTED